MTVEQIRQSLNLTQEQFAERIGISKRAYTNKVKNRSPWTVPELLKICQFGEVEIASDSSTLYCSIVSHNV